MAAYFRLCKVLSLPETLLSDAMYMVKDGDSVVIYVTDEAGNALPFKPGLSAYEVAVSLGFVGTEAEWIASLQGVDGISAYQVAVNNGFVGTEQEWLDSLHYDPGYTPENAANKSNDTELASDSETEYPTVHAVKAFATAKAGEAVTLANSYADTAADGAESAAKSYADTVAADAEVAAKAYADLLVTSALKLRGGYDASGNAWPTTGGSGASGAILAGDLWFVSVPGTLAGKPVVIGDSFFAVANAPGQTAANWCVLDTNLGFVPEEAGTASAAIAAHLLASDPHGDRSYADGIVSALQSAVEASLALRLRVDADQSLTGTQKRQARKNAGFDRVSASVTTASLSPQGYATGAINLARAFTVFAITTDYPCRVRLYDTIAHRNDDLNRGVGIYPADNSGCFFEFISSNSMLSASINKAINGFNNEASISEAIPYTITNLDASTRAITVGLTVLPQE